MGWCPPTHGRPHRGQPWATQKKPVPGRAWRCSKDFIRTHRISTRLTSEMFFLDCPRLTLRGSTVGGGCRLSTPDGVVSFELSRLYARQIEFHQIAKAGEALVGGVAGLETVFHEGERDFIRDGRGLIAGSVAYHDGGLEGISLDHPS